MFDPFAARRMEKINEYGRGVFVEHLGVEGVFVERLGTQGLELWKPCRLR